jgi:hypothetical protein
MEYLFFFFLTSKKHNISLIFKIYITPNPLLAIFCNCVFYSVKFELNTCIVELFYEKMKSYTVRFLLFGLLIELYK